MPTSDYLQPAISNGHPMEQALIRRWWSEVHAARGCIVWEYYLGDCYADAIWFPEAEASGTEYPGTSATTRFPICGSSIVLCEAKLRLTPELIGQGLVYRHLAKVAGARIQSVVLFAERSSLAFRSAAEEAGFQVVLQRDA
jgi:hypothetical protein